MTAVPIKDDRQMLFNSYIFIFLFLPLCLAGYFVINRFGKKRLALAYLLGMSLWFYGANTPVYLLLIVSSVLVNYGFYMLSKRLSGCMRTAAKAAAVTLNLGVLFYFKYYDFFVSTVNSLFGCDWALKHIILPLGISFFTFQQVSFVADAFNGEVPDYGLLEYACFVTYFPQLVAGPIVTHDELVPQLLDDSKKRFDWENFARGVYIFAMGLGKKVLIADSLSRVVAAGFAFPTPLLDSLGCFIVMLAFSLQLYFDFSGYSDMAIGLGKMFNIDLPQNFNSPYKSENVVEFWRNWHITLSRFFTKYVYFPLGGSRKGLARTYLNVFIVFLLSGLWHGANWTFIIWGMMHGAAQIVYRVGKKFFDRLPKAVGRTVTFLFISLCLVVFRADNVSQGFAIIGRIFEFDFSAGISSLGYCFDFSELRHVLSLIPAVGGYLAQPLPLLVIFLAGILFITQFTPNAYERMKRLKPNAVNLIASAALIFWCAISFGKVSEFLYFNF